MGRVDDAMRRAAAEASGHAAAPVADAEAAVAFAPEPSADAATLGVLPAPEVIDADGEDAAELSAVDAIEREVGLPDRASSGRRKSRFAEAVNRDLTGKLVADETMPPASREQYRRLAATLHRTQAASGLKVVMIASAVAGEGKTLTAANLALTFSESYRKSVLLIDGDLRRPSLHTVFSIEGVPGLSDMLGAVEHGTLPLHRVSERLAILPAGRPTSDPMAALTSDRMQGLIEEAREAFDWVIIDTPPIGLITDANLLGSMVDGAILVVKAGSTPYTLAQRAIDALGRDRLLGAVLNRATANPHAGHKYYYDYYSSRPRGTSARS